MKNIDKIDIPITELVCLECTSKLHSELSDKVSIFDNYENLNYSIISIGLLNSDVNAEPITVSVNIKKIKWQKEETNLYKAYALIEYNCLCCETDKQLTQILEIPQIVITNLQKCKQCNGPLTLVKEIIEYNSSDNTIEFEGFLECVNCSTKINVSDKINTLSFEEKISINIDKIMNTKTKILFLSSNPEDTHFLRLDKEIRAIEAELVKAKFRDEFEFVKILAVRIEDIQDALLNQQPNFVHFSGHGNKNGIYLLNEFDKADLVEGLPLSNLFKLFSDSIKCIFLNSCYSDSQASSIVRYIDYVIGMSNSIPDDTAIEFAKAFYKAIGARKNIKFAFELAINGIDLKGKHGSDIPKINIK